MYRSLGRTLLIRSLLLIVGGTALAGCTFRPEIKHAWVEKTTGSDAIIHVRLSGQDANVIKRRQLYFSLTVINCKGEPEGYPAEPYISGERATHFNFRIPDNEIEFTGKIPLQSLQRYSSPCILLEGGGYFTGKLRSPPVILAAANASKK
jgi:hypothetical protein